MTAAPPGPEHDGASSDSPASTAGDDGPRRLDLALVERGLARSRGAARAAIEGGRVSVDGRPVVKPAHPVAAASTISVDGDDRYVSRAAHKLVAGLDAAGGGSSPLDITGMLALDLGASTGGFTQVLLERGARQVIALDVGHGQLAPELRADPRVVVVEGENARELDAARLSEVSGVVARPDLVVGDLSFISLRLILPAIVATVGTAVPLILLIKPQFEAGRQGIREGVVRDAAVREDAIMGVLWAGHDLGLEVAALLSSPIVGTGGNHEYLVVFRPTDGGHPSEWRGRAAELARKGSP
ncbi:TlyA family RNA methyltransferase [Microcella frigidaquae]|uniref:23S rRNA (Cytidine1920-2'-O)/16S rRNA (Cytidine1409-2'-O)-methyltransferase n=1 Tax=Microcella frigidaquae TaxID=424758 RepID=A0A840XM28_9MICO|nr:TlyA family RNA methyltransferase [Microcella frigidaquae]MBB5616959.1 23S rRNA (cytidine1920-2'-O)/16S rRNA (cytidine1409-2'-O)-methyltransferase [Microcella frigidaquae]NHN45456.1 TlyA family RNA methyltransferase [Microcella frigidaquae]